MPSPDPQLEPFSALIGTWVTEATHPELDAVVSGSTDYAWLEGERFVIQRSRNDHEQFPDAVSVIGPDPAGEGLVMEYFDSRGARRTYGISLDDGVLRMERAEPGFDQRFTAVIAPEAFEGHWQLARSPGEWRDDLSVRYRREERAEAEALHLFAGLRVRDFSAARPWYERLFGEPSFFPHETEAVWTLDADRSVYVVEHPDGAGRSVVTVFVDDLDGRTAAAGARGIEPAERETLGNGVRRTTYRDPDGNEVVFAGPPLTRP